MRKYIQFMIVLLCLSFGVQAQQDIYIRTFNNELYLTIEILDDDLAHFEISPTAPEAETIATSAMIAKTDYPGPSAIEFPSDYEIVTPEMHLLIDAESLCVTVTDRIREITLTTVCPLVDEENTIGGLTFSQEGTTDLYGLGEQFRRRGDGADGNWIGERRLAANTFGNGLASFNGGNVGNAQFPVLYALGEGTNNYALFVDHVYQQFWAMNNDPFVMQTSNAPLRWYVMTGENLPDLRSDYMELTGTPPVPPRQMFGLWVSEFGYDNWNEMLGVLTSLQDENFPIDGFVLDLQWFGNVGTPSQMGSLTWDERNFPNPTEFIAQLRADYGISLMTIEESYVATQAEGYNEAIDALVQSCEGCEPVRLVSWWGNGGMVDWTNPDAAAWWHDNRRQHLVDSGIIGHWTDLGEPENYDEGAWYFGGDHTHASIHNLYNFYWSQSIWDGYQRHDIERRPFILSRSGTAGSQRYGVAMWSGDIGANVLSLAEQMNVQMQMSLSGIDYFGSDIGGFYRQAADPLLDEDRMYTTWYANSALLDVPLRPHTSNMQNRYQTAPSLIGDVASNLANTQLRYETSPYLYTLAHLAYRTGEAVYPPLVYYFQDDPTVRTIGGQKMIGSQMMMATLVDYDPEETTVYLPEGGWFDYHTEEYIQSTGETRDYEAGEILQAPLLVRDGAVLPLLDGEVHNLLDDNPIVFNIYHAMEDGSFTLIEDDGETMAYQTGDVRETTVSHTLDDNRIVVTISANGTYAGAPEERNIKVRLIAPNFIVGRVLLNGEEITLGDDGTVESGLVPVNAPLEFVFEAATEGEAMRPLLLTHYMPWYQANGSWGWHWTMDHFDPNQVDENGRPQIASQFMPLTGAYDSQDDAILEYQVLLMKLSGIDGVIVDWYGTSNYNDYGSINAATGKLFDYITRAGLQFAICYEDRTLTTMTNDGHLNATTALEQGQADMTYANEQWFSSESYVTYEGQPLVFVFGPLYFRQVSDWTNNFANIDPVPGLVTLDQNLSFAALAGYPWPPMQMSGGLELNPAVLQSYLEQFYRNAHRRDLIVGSAFPGFYDIYEQAGVRSSYGYLDARDGATLQETLDLALAQEPDIIQLVTWNDYGEGTTIEPTEEYGYQYLEIIQQTRRELDSDFTTLPDDLRLAMQLFEARRTHPGDNAELDQVFDAIIAGDLETARDILDGYTE